MDNFNNEQKIYGTISGFDFLEKITIKNLNINNSSEKNNISSEAVTDINNSTKKDPELNLRIANSLFKIFIDEGFIKLNNYGYNFSFEDREFFLSLKATSVEFVDIYAKNKHSIKFSTKYLNSNLFDVICYYIQHVNNTKYNVLMDLIRINKLYDLDEMKEFLCDYSIFKYKPDNLVLNKNIDYYEEILSLLDLVYLDKLIINNYCFNVVAVSFADSYFFSKEKRNNILFQRLDPYLNLNPLIYEIQI
ncbi:MAG: hypothetical protein EOP33_06595 [Rickettsiaceae bacterium]|nr:MAG: hypothetical protein EOP33_06595 [Rickettsiaceae bacterium]